MKIETDDWIPLSEVVATRGIAQKTAYRIAERLGIAVDLFGVRVIRKADVERLLADKMPRGNPDWIGDYDKASEAAIKSVESRMRRVAVSGLTKSEKLRNKKLAAIGRTKGGRKPRAAKPADAND